MKGIVIFFNCSGNNDIDFMQWLEKKKIKYTSGVGKGGQGGATAPPPPPPPPPTFKSGGAMPPYFYTSGTTDKCVICNELH